MYVNITAMYYSPAPLFPNFVISLSELIHGRLQIIPPTMFILCFLTMPPMPTLSQSTTTALKLDRHVFSLLQQRTYPKLNSFFGITVTRQLPFTEPIHLLRTDYRGLQNKNLKRLVEWSRLHLKATAFFIKTCLKVTCC